MNKPKMTPTAIREDKGRSEPYKKHLDDLKLVDMKLDYFMLGFIIGGVERLIGSM